MLTTKLEGCLVNGAARGDLSSEKVYVKLQKMIERPISVLGSRDIANRVYCAKDKEQAVRAAYAGEPLPDARCDTSGLDANERFAKARGFTGTPVIVRGDGAMIEGYRPREFLETWLKGDKP